MRQTIVVVQRSILVEVNRVGSHKIWIFEKDVSLSARMLEERKECNLPTLLQHLSSRLSNRKYNSYLDSVFRVTRNDQ